MITQVLHCPYCQGTDIVRHGTSPEGKQRYRCRACPERGRTFLLEYTYAGQSPEVKQKIVDMALNASGIRDTAWVLHVSPTTVIKELKKRNRTSNRWTRIKRLVRRTICFSKTMTMHDLVIGLFINRYEFGLLI